MASAPCGYCGEPFTDVAAALAHIETCIKKPKPASPAPINKPKKKNDTK